jgi:hypothetical protein
MSRLSSQLCPSRRFLHFQKSNPYMQDLADRDDVIFSGSLRTLFITGTLTGIKAVVLGYIRISDLIP